MATVKPSHTPTKVTKPLNNNPVALPIRASIMPPKSKPSSVLNFAKNPAISLPTSTTNPTKLLIAGIMPLTISAEPIAAPLKSSTPIPNMPNISLMPSSITFITSGLANKL